MMVNLLFVKNPVSWFRRAEIDSWTFLGVNTFNKGLVWDSQVVYVKPALVPFNTPELSIITDCRRWVYDSRTILVRVTLGDIAHIALDWCDIHLYSVISLHMSLDCPFDRLLLYQYSMFSYNFQEGADINRVIIQVPITTH